MFSCLSWLVAVDWCVWRIFGDDSSNDGTIIGKIGCVDVSDDVFNSFSLCEIAFVALSIAVGRSLSSVSVV